MLRCSTLCSRPVRFFSTGLKRRVWSEEVTKPLTSFLGVPLQEGASLELSQQQLEDLLGTEDLKLAEAYCVQANSVTERLYSTNVQIHGFMDLHNMCERNCQHCYIRRSNKDVKRFMCFPTHVYDNAEWLYGKGIGTLVVSSGEFNNEGRTEFIEGILENTIQRTKAQDRSFREKQGEYTDGVPMQLGLQMGEIPMHTNHRYFAKGARLAYLRMEATDRLLYKDIFIRERGYDERMNTIERMMKEGYEVYSGTLIGLPFQTKENIVEDILKMKEMQVDGLDYDVYMPTKETPIYPFWREQNKNAYSAYLKASYEQLRRVIALSRLVYSEASITTSEHHMLLQTNGLSDLLNCGANVVKMFSGPQWTRFFNLYFDEMEPAFPEEEVLQHNLQFIQEAGKKPLLDHSASHSLAYLKRTHSV